jgi:transposase
MWKFIIRAGDMAVLLARFGDLQRKVEARTGQCFGIISIQEAGLDGFCAPGSRVRRLRELISSTLHPLRRRADGAAQRPIGLMARHGLEPCWPISAASRDAMLRVPSPEEKDRRRAMRERKALLTRE